MHSITTLILLFALCQAAPVGAMSMLTTTRGEPVVSGGVGAEEIAALRQQRSRYTLHILTAARGSGAYLAGALVKVADERGALVLEAHADGPWMLLRLKPGEYRVTVSYGSATQASRTRITQGQTRELMFYFDETVERLPKGATE
ncbi:MAG: carboxypeptidase-like regulatory domain-containing protein [Burkholderiales bacterium]